MLKIKPKIKNSKAFGLAVAGLTLAMVSTCTTSAIAVEQERLIEKNSTVLKQEQIVIPFTAEYVAELAEQEKIDYENAINFEIAKEEARINNPKSLQSKFVNKAMDYENTGRWVFAGSTPGAWDCSGFIMYVARNSIELELYHSATAQMETGAFVKTPLKGDLVGLYYYNSSVMSSHIGIYVGDGKFIHVSETRGTVVDDVSDYADSYDIRYSRIIEKDRNWSPKGELEKKEKLFNSLIFPPSN
jgi:cell wall-associated NlpC family hydrolase